MEKVKEKCNMKHGLIVPSNGNSGGPVLLWKEDIKVEVQTYSQDYIDVAMWAYGTSQVSMVILIQQKDQIHEQNYDISKGPHLFHGLQLVTLTN